MESFRHNDVDGDWLSIEEHRHTDQHRLWLVFQASGGGVGMFHEDATRLRDWLNAWLGEDAQSAPSIAPLTPADVRAIATQAAAEVMALHQGPQARYEDAVAARLCTIPGCPAFPGAAQHFEHGEPCDGTACCEPHPTYADPEPHDVGHPEPDPCPLVQPLRARPDDRCGDCGGTWRHHRMPFCTGCGHGTLFHNKHDGCVAILGKTHRGCRAGTP